MAIQILIGMEKLRARASDFDRIFRSVATPATGRMPGLLIWMETHPTFEPWGVLIERNGEMVAAAILTRYRRFGLWRIGKPGGIHDPVRFGVLDDDAAAKLAQAIFDAVQSFGSPWRLEVSDLPCPDPVASHLQSICPHSQIQSISPIPCLRFTPDTPLSKYLSSNTRSAVSKARNRILHDGIQIVQEWTSDIKRIQYLLPQILDTYRCRDHQLYGNCLIDDAMAEQFFIKFVTEHASQGLIDLLTINLDGELAAFALCLLDNGEHWVLVNRASTLILKVVPTVLYRRVILRKCSNEITEVKSTHNLMSLLKC